MKALKVLGIIGIILSALGMLVCLAPEAQIVVGLAFWLFINSSFLLALSIVAIVKSKYTKI